MTSLKRRIGRNRKQAPDAAAAAGLFGPVPRELSRLSARPAAAARPALRLGQQPRTLGLRPVSAPQMPIPQELRDAVRGLAVELRAQTAARAATAEPARVDAGKSPAPRPQVPAPALDEDGWPLVAPLDEDTELVGYLNAMGRRVHAQADRMAKAFDQKAIALGTHMQVWARRRGQEIAASEGRHLAAAYEIGGTEAYQGLAAEVRAMINQNALAGAR